MWKCVNCLTQAISHGLDFCPKCRKPRSEVDADLQAQAGTPRDDSPAADTSASPTPSNGAAETPEGAVAQPPKASGTRATPAKQEAK
jgi:hypothetical protein